MPKSAAKKAIQSPATTSTPTKSAKQTAATTSSEQPIRGSKKSRIIAMLRSPTGATIASMAKATGWQQHTVRGFLTTVIRKRLLMKLESTKIDGHRVYRIAKGRLSDLRKDTLR